MQRRGEPADRNGIRFVRLPGGGSVAFRPYDARSVELLMRLHRSSRFAVQWAFGVLRRHGSAGQFLSALYPPGAGTDAESGELLQAVTALLEEEPASFAISLSADLSRAKIALLEQSGRTLFVKADTDSRGPLAEASFLGEPRALARGVVAPKVLGCGSVGKWTMVALSDVGSGRPRGLLLSLADVIPHLNAVRSTSAIEVSLPEALDLIEATLDGHLADTSPLFADMRKNSTEGSVGMAVAHGDFVPWNMELLSDGLHLWDWERAMRSAPWPYDAIHFSLQTHRFVHRKSRSQALSGAMEDLNRHSAALGMSGSDREVVRSFALYAGCRALNEFRIRHVGTDAAWLVDAMRDFV